MTLKHRLIVAFILGVAVSVAAPAGAQDVSGREARTGRAGAGRRSRAPEAKKADPFAFADFTWLTGNPRTKESPLDTKVFTGEFRADTNFTYSFNNPQDDTISRLERDLPITASSRSRSSASAATSTTTTCRAG